MAARLTHKTGTRQKAERGYAGSGLIGAATIASLGLGIAAPIAGMALAIVNEVVPGVPELQSAATILCVSTIPLLLLGSHLMDVIETRRAPRREKECGSEKQE